MMAEIKLRLTTNNIFTTIVVALIPIKYRFFATPIMSFYISIYNQSSETQVVTSSLIN